MGNASRCWVLEMSCGLKVIIGLVEFRDRREITMLSWLDM